MEKNMDPTPAIYWTRPVTCICLCSVLDNSLGPLARESPCKLPRVMKHYCTTGRRNHGRPLKRLLDT